jgi:hypothetical protein
MTSRYHEDSIRWLRGTPSARILPVLLIGLAICAACVAHNPAGAPVKISKDDGCLAPELVWMEVSQTLDSRELADLAGKLEIAAQADAKELKNPAITLSEILASLKKVNADQLGISKKAKVSQAFFERAMAYRQAICNLERQIQSGAIENAQVRIEAERQLLSHSNFFGNVRLEEEKKFQRISDNPVFSIYDGSSQRVIGRVKLSSPGVYELDEDLHVGDCIMSKGSRIAFTPDGYARYKLSVWTTHTNFRDIWHQQWILEGSRQVPPHELDSPDLHEDAPKTMWTGDFKYEGPVPTGEITWRSRC